MKQKILSTLLSLYLLFPTFGQDLGKYNELVSEARKLYEAKHDLGY